MGRCIWCDKTNSEIQVDYYICKAHNISGDSKRCICCDNKTDAYKNGCCIFTEIDDDMYPWCSQCKFVVKYVHAHTEKICAKIEECEKKFEDLITIIRENK